MFIFNFSCLIFIVFICYFEFLICQLFSYYML